MKTLVAIMTADIITLSTNMVVVGQLYIRYNLCRMYRDLMKVGHTRGVNIRPESLQLLNIFIDSYDKFTPTVFMLYYNYIS